MEYVISSGRKTLKVKRIAGDKISLSIGSEKAECFTEDLAALVRDCLPEDRAAELFSEIEEKMMSSGKARVIVRAQKDIKQGEPVAFTIDVNKYMDSHGRFTGIRTTKSGFIH